MDKIRSQEKLAEYYNGLSKSKPVMRVSIYPTHPLQGSHVIQALEAAGLLDKADVEIYPSLGPLISPLRPIMTRRHVHQTSRGRQRILSPLRSKLPFRSDRQDR